MKHRSRSLLSALQPALALTLVLFGVSAPLSGMAAGTWTALANTAPDTVSLMLLLSDGTVMCQDSGNTGWYRLTPNIHGSYVNGTWTTLAPMNYSRRYYSSQVLRNGQVFVAGGEYGSGGQYAEVYNPLANTWTITPSAPGAPNFNFIDSISETLPNGNVLIAPVTPVTYGGTVIYNYTSNTWTTGATLYRGDDQDEAAWTKLPDTSILTIDPFGTNSERYIPSLNQWINDANVPVVMYGYGGELGAGFLLPNGNAFYIGGTNHTAIYTPTGTTNAGVWTAGATIPNNLGAVDAPAAMMVNGNVLCALGPDTGYFSPTYFYEYNYVSNSFTLVGSPTGGTSDNVVPYGCTMLDLPDGTVLFSGNGSQLYDYQPSGSPVTNGIPAIISATTNLDGSFHVTGTLFNGISEGAAYGDDSQMASDYPVARITNAAGSVLYCRTYNWSACNIVTGTNVVTTEMTLPAGLLAGTYPLCITANGISSAPYSLTILGTPLAAVNGLAFSTIASNQMALQWNAIGSTEAGYVVQRSTDGVNYSTVASLASSVTNYTDNAVTPLGQYYYTVLGTNAFGLGNAATPIFAASPPVAAAAVFAPWQAQDVGAVLGSGASGTNAGVFTVIGSGGGGGASDQFQFAAEPVAGDVTITARVTASQNTGTNALAGVMLRNGLDTSSADAVMVFDGGNSNAVFQTRASDGATAAGVNGSGGLAVPYWVRLVRSGNAVSGFTSPDGTTWTQQGAATIIMQPVVYAGLAVSSGTSNLLNTSTFDNVTVTGTAAATPPPLAEWKLDETSGATAVDSRGDYDGTYNNVILGQPGATPDTGYSAGFNGTNANISIPPLNLNSNVLTITAWVNRNGNQSLSSGIFFNRANSTVSGLTFDNTTANVLSYTWNNNGSTYGAHSGLVVPNNQWTFVALVVEPTRARIYMVTNGVMAGWTNNVANVVQAFDGTSYVGQDSTSSSRYFNGLLDEVQFFNQVLTPAQLAEMAAQPVITLTSPTNGGMFQAFASLNLSASLSATNSHTINSVQYFSGNGQLLGESATPPFSTTTTNLNVGSYAVFARLFYDSGYSVDSALNSVIVSVQPSITNTWDANGSVAGAQDGNGNWGGGTTNWWNGSADVVWTDYSLAAFGSGTTTNCTVTLTNNVTPYAITFNANAGGSYTLAGTNAILLNVPGTPLDITASGGATISAPLQGNNSLVKLGAGTLTLSGANSYSGATIVGAGILQLGTTNAFGSSAFVTNTGTLDLNGHDFTASMFNRSVALSGAGAGGTALTNSSSAARGQLQDVVLEGNATIAGANTIFIGGTNAQNGVLNLNGYTLTLGGSGTVVLNGVNMAGAGNITASAGTLQLMDTYGNNQQATTLAGSGNLTINPGASVMTYRWGSALAVTMPVIMNGGTLGSGWPGPNGATYACPILVNTNSTFNFSGGYDSCIFSGNITGAAGLTVTGGSATRTFTGTNSYGWTTISAGVLQIGNGGGTGTLGLGNVTNNATLTFSRTGTLSVSNRISGTGALIQNGAGTITLFGTNLYTGGTTLAAGILNVSAPETAGTSGPLGKSGTIAFAGGTLQYSSVDTFDYSSRFSTATNQAISIDTAGQNVNFATALTSAGGGSLAKLGAGTLTLAGANTYNGPTVVGVGTLALSGSLKGGAIMVSNSAALLVKANGAAAIITNAASLTFGTTGATTFTVSNFAGNATAPVNVTNLAANGTVTVNLFGLPALGQYPLIKYTGAIGGSGYAAFTLGTAPGNVFVSLSNNTANASVDVVVATNTLVWSGAVNGTWDVGTTANWTRGGAGTVFNANANAQFDDTASGTTAVTLNTSVSPSGVNFANSSKNYSISGSGSIGGSTALAKAGAGTLMLSTTNTYTGQTTVGGGTLLVNGSLPTGPVTVAASATLAGNGEIYGPTTVQPGGTLQPGLGGTNISTLTISNSLNLSGSVLFALNRTNAQTASEIAGLGTVTCGGTLTATNVGPTNFVGGDNFTLIQATNYSGGFTNLTLPGLPAGLIWNTNSLAVNGAILVSNITYTLTYTAGANGTIGGTSPQTVNYGASGVAVTAIPNAGYSFTNWSDGSTANPRTDADVTNNLAVTANFTADPAAGVVLTAPTNGSSYTAPATINLAANVTTNGNTINAVQFYSNTTNLLATVVTAPYAFAWTNAAAGSYSLLAQVLFNGNASNDSAGVVIVVSNAAPVMPVIAPKSLALTGGGFILGGTGGAGQAYILLTASNLASPVWLPIATNVADTTGVFNFSDPGATNLPQRFYLIMTQ